MTTTLPTPTTTVPTIDDLERRGATLAKIVRRVRELVSAGRPLDAGSLAVILEDHPASFDDVRTFIRFDEVNYVRSLVYREDAFEVRLLCWRPGQSSAIHGHGRSACAFRVIRGAATEIVVGGRDRVHPPGAIVEEADPARVHQVMNCERDNLLSLHIYAPPIPIDAPSDRRGHEITIVGGGASGVAVAFHLLKRADRDLRVSLVERGPMLGRGIAYGVESELFLLNVPASRMSVDPDDPLDFVRYAKSEEHPHAFLPRSLYGAYLSDRLAKLIRERRGKLRVYRDEAVGIRATDEGAKVTLRSGLALDARKVIVATGLAPRLTERTYDPRVIDGWDECALGGLPRYGRILILGAGLSALDTLAWLEHTQFRGTVRMVSPKGLLPRPHRRDHDKVAPLTEAELLSLPATLSGRIRWLRAAIAEAEAQGKGFQVVIDRLRPHVETLYRSLSLADRRRFVRHTRSYWDVVRHRAPIESLERVERMEREGRLARTAGRVVAEDRSGATIVATIQTRRGPRIEDRFDAIVRCIGPSMSLADSATPFTESLVDEGLARVEASGLGLETDRDGALVGRDGMSSTVLYGLGAVRRASAWETTSMPDISVHARRIAEACLGPLDPR